MNLNNFSKFFKYKYLLYPQNISSPPSPERATVIFFLANSDKINVGIWENLKMALHKFY